jgi:hypothetical protein
VVANKAPAAAPPVVVNKPVARLPVAAYKPPVAPPAEVRKPPTVEASPVGAMNQAAPGGEPPPVRARPAPAEIALPFDAALGTILYSADRKLAIIDNRIVGVGDEVKGARITEITPGTVLLRDAQGRLRRLTLGATGR